VYVRVAIGARSSSWIVVAVQWGRSRPGDRAGPTDLPVHRPLRGRLPERARKWMARERGVPPGAKVRDLDVLDWAALLLLVHYAAFGNDAS
jgi:hypothetical protein